MVSTYTPNIQLEEPARGDYVGTWDVPVNNNMTLIDLVLGGRTTINGSGGSVTLAAAQFQCKTITINSTLLASITLTFPTSFSKSYEIQNSCTGSSAFVITLQTTAAGGQVVCCPPGEIFEVVNDGTNIKFKNFGRVGSYWDYAGSSVPAWVSGCTVPPYLNCDGTTFSAATFPQLAVVLGSTTLPDSRGSVRAALNQGTARLSSANGVDGNTNFSQGGAASVTLNTSQIPSHNHGITDTHSHQYIRPSGNNTSTGGGGFTVYDGGSPGFATQTSGTNSGAITVNLAGGGGGHANVQPTLVAGLMLIRAG